MSYVYPIGTCSVRFNGRVVRLKRKSPIDASDPLVKARPELFSPDPDASPRERGVERATKKPGEKRG